MCPCRGWEKRKFETQSFAIFQKCAKIREITNRLLPSLLPTSQDHMVSGALGLRMDLQGYQNFYIWNLSAIREGYKAAPPSSIYAVVEQRRAETTGIHEEFP